ncbi:hypothetical protein V1291_005285 [Nitrobacteraceae bacterium AZCC 1564]
MPTYAIVEVSGAITNNIILDEGSVWQAPEGCSIIVNDDQVYRIGGTLIDGVYTAPVTEAQPLPASALPKTATKLGLKRAFDELGMWDRVKAVIAADSEAQEEWGLALEIKRSDPLTQKLIAVLQLPTETVDHIIIRANELV